MTVTPQQMKPLMPEPAQIPGINDAGVSPGQAMSSTVVAPVTSNPVVAGVSSNETVAGQIKNLIADGNPLLENAKAGAQQASAARGLQNSSIAAQSGQKALLDSALPIATQDATTNAARVTQNLNSLNSFGQTKQQGDINSQLQSEAATQKKDLLKQEGEQTAAQQTRDAQTQYTLSDKNFQNQQSLMIAEYGQRIGLSSVEQSNELQKIQVQHENTLAQIAAQAEAMKVTDLGPKLQSQYLSTVSERMQSGSSEIAQIYSTQGLTSTQQQTAVENAYARMKTDLNTIASTFAQSPLWDPAWGQGGSSAPGAATGADFTIPEQQSTALPPPAQLPGQPRKGGG